MENNTKNIRKGVTAILFATIMIASVSVVATASELPILDFDLRQGSGTTIIDSANGIVGTTHGTVWSTDPSGQPVLYFDNSIKYWFGDGDYMEIPYHDALNSPHITIEIWVYPMSCGYYTVFAERIRDGGTWQTMTYLGLVATGYHTGTKPRFYLTVGGVGKHVTSPTEITLNEWHHIVGTYDGNDMKLYVDGEHVATELGVGGPRDTGSNPLYLGHAPSGNHYFNGYYAGFKMYDRALTTEEITGAPVSANVTIKPETLNKKSKGKWVTVYTELPAGYNVTDINISSMMFNETVPAELHPTEIGDYDSDGIPDLMVKFDRQAVIDILPIGDAVNVTVTGKLFDETPFESSDTIRVIDKGKGK